jgi:alkanesulfonate monooxygenase
MSKLPAPATPIRPRTATGRITRLRYRGAQEYVALLRRTWTEPAPFDHEGEFYRMRATYSEVRCHQQPHILIYRGGGSE